MAILKLLQVAESPYSDFRRLKKSKSEEAISCTKMEIKQKEKTEEEKVAKKIHKES